MLLSVTGPEAFNQPASVWNADVGFGFGCRCCAAKQDMCSPCGFCLENKGLTTSNLLEDRRVDYMQTVAGSICSVHGMKGSREYVLGVVKSADAACIL